MSGVNVVICINKKHFSKEMHIDKLKLADFMIMIVA